MEMKIYSLSLGAFMPLSFAWNILIKWQILLPFHILSVIKSLTFYLAEAWKEYLFWVEAPCQDH